jgi:NhaP-type Na+/H+ or K+/H+ antiporter
LFQIPVSIVGGIVLGLILGYFISKYFIKKYTAVRATEKTLILLSFSVLLVQIGDWINVAALLAVMSVGFMILENNQTVALELSNKMSKIWIFAQIILFVLIGLAVDYKIAYNAGLKTIGVLCIGLIFRSAGVWISTVFSDLNYKERIFCMIAYLPKATVQAALGSVALNNGIENGSLILAIAVLSIIFTAPLGLIGIRISSKYLLVNDFKN